MEKIDLDLDNENEMVFRVQIQGTRPGQPLCRLMIENNDITHTITGDFLKNNEVAILIPPMKGLVSEGTYDSYLEVLVDDRVFIPLEMQINFEESVMVVAETISRKSKPKFSASASLVSSRQTKKIDESEKPVIKATHPAKVRRDKRLEEVRNSNKKENTYSEKDIMDLVRKIRNKSKN